jgi:hypothetical protein
LAVLAEHAQLTQDADESLRSEVSDWIGGDRAGGVGIPDGSLPKELPLTTVTERDFGASGRLLAGSGHDTAATFAVLFGAGDDPVDWLRAGEALSAVWLAATEHGLSLLPLSSPVEVPHIRHELRRLLGDIGNPYLVVRLGALRSAEAGPTYPPRLPAEKVIEVAD